MAQYFTSDFADFGECSGADCGDWTKRYRTDKTWTVSGGDITIPVSSASDWTALTWDDIGADADRDDIELLVKLTTGSSSVSSFALIVRGSGADETATHYVVYVGVSVDALRVYYCSGSDTPVEVASTSKTLDTSTVYWVRFRVNGTTIKAAIWADGGAFSTWDVEADDSTVSGTGWAGLSSYGTSTVGTIHQLGVGTNGDVAPSSGSVALVGYWGINA